MSAPRYIPINQIFPENIIPGYDEPLRSAASAYEQMSGGKGIERHAVDTEINDITDQPMFRLPEMSGDPYSLMFQILKKVLESKKMNDRCEHGRAGAELDGALVYLMCMRALVKRQEDHGTVIKPKQ